MFKGGAFSVHFDKGLLDNPKSVPKVKGRKKVSGSFEPDTFDFFKF